MSKYRARRRNRKICNIKRSIRFTSITTERNVIVTTSGKQIEEQKLAEI